jgi:hypothetical protein
MILREIGGELVHELGTDDISNVDGDSNYVRVQVLTNASVLTREKQLGDSRTTHRHRRRCRWRSDAGRPDMGATH